MTDRPLSCATKHATARALERYSIAATDADWRDCLIDITSAVAGLASAAVLLGAGVGGERWLVRLRGIPVVAVYSPSAAIVVTLLEPTRDRRFSGVYDRQSQRGRQRRERARSWMDEEG